MSAIPGNGRPPGNGKSMVDQAAAAAAQKPQPAETPGWFPRGVHPGIQPAIMPCQSFVDQVPMPDGSIGVLIRLVSPAGLWVNVVPADFAAAFAASLTQTAQAARSGLIVPGQQ